MHRIVSFSDSYFYNSAITHSSVHLENIYYLPFGEAPAIIYLTKEIHEMLFLNLCLSNGGNPSLVSVTELYSIS